MRGTEWWGGEWGPDLPEGTSQCCWSPFSFPRLPLPHPEGCGLTLPASFWGAGVGVRKGRR